VLSDVFIKESGGSRRARRAYYTTNLEHETEIESGGSLFVARESGVL